MVNNFEPSTILGAENVAKATTVKGVEWVVANYNVKVRQSPSIRSRQLGSKAKGIVVFGKKQGMWLSLIQEIGYVRIELGGTKLLEPREVEYSRVSKGSCGDSGRHAISDPGVCKEASRLLGNKAAGVHIYTGDEARPYGCYIEGSTLWMTASSTNPNDLSDGGCRGSCSVGNASRVLLCSSEAYKPPGTGFLASGAIESRVHAVKQSLTKSFGQCKKSKKSCRVLWSKGIKDFVKYGFGSAMKFFQPFRAYLAFAGCDLVVNDDLAKEWLQHGLAPFWNLRISDQEWKLVKAPKCPISFLKRWKPDTVRCDTPQPGDVSDEHRLAFSLSTYYNKSPFHGYMNLLLQTLAPKFLSAKQPFQKRYAAFHVRRGDMIPAMSKQGKGHRLDGINVPLFTAILRARWPGINQIFVASDDQDEVATATKMGQGGLVFNWTSKERRWPGGTPVTQSQDHVNADDDVAAVLDDMVAMAGAAVLIGGSDSSFFYIARLLNLGLHMDSQRPYPWCYDAFLHKVCD